ASITLWAGSDSSGVWRSTNGGGSWTQRSTGIPDIFIHDLLADPSSPLVSYAATNTGVYRTMDGGGSWAPINSGLPLVPAARALARDATRPGVLFCGLENAGVYETQNGGGSW